ncbi:protein rep [Metabacillus indicus]|uniref:protein rep n=1 Tax=Metabacillus indicus TaxID=246786 RepID=UPI00249067E0|nr:protein rep [Metabacillus indicus]
MDSTKEKEKELGEVELELDERLRLARTERYACQSIVREVFPSERVAICLRNRIKVFNEYDGIKVWRHKKTSKAFYSGLMVCGSVWLCPVCAAKISERRRRELQQAFEQHKKDGGQIALLTLTFSHKRFDALKDILNLFSKATEKFMSGRAFQNIRAEMGLIGRVRALEVTYSDANGFHPHAHIALFYTNKVNLNDIEEQMYVLWKKACSKVGLTIDRKHGISLEKGEKADDYIAKHGKWGIDHELTKAHIKKAKFKSLTPFDFLRNYLATEDKRYLILFKEYAECFKGKRQLQWSQGLKQKFVMEEKNDEQLAKEQTEQADLLGLIDYWIWKDILKQNKRSYFLDLCETKSFEEALENIAEYKKQRIKKAKSLCEELDRKSNIK